MELYGVPLRFILPHVFLPLSCIAGLLSPQFKGRGIIWASLITYCAYLTLVDEWPYDTQVKFSLRQTWFAYFPTISYLLFSEPEKSYWRADKEKEEATKMGVGWKKLWWATALWFNPRGIGWNFQLKQIPESHYEKYSTRRFLIRQAVSLVWHLFILDTCLYILRNYLAPRDPNQIKNITELQWALIQTLFTVLTYVTWYSPWLAVSIPSVAYGLTQPKDWPPFFGKVRHCTTVGYYWGTYWHQVLRKPVLDFGRFIAKQFGIPHGTHAARVVYLMTSFVISGYFHAISFANLKPYPATDYVYKNTMLFFVSQAFGIMLETFVINEYNRWNKQRARTADGQKKSVDPFSNAAFRRVMGWAWVWVWLFYSGRPFADMLLRTDMVWWKPPLPILEWVIGA